MESFNLCKKFIKKYRVMLYMYFICGILSSIVSVILPMMTGVFIDLIVYNTSKNYLKSYFYLFLILNLGKFILEYVSKLNYVKIQTNGAYDLNYYILNHMKNLPISFFNNKDTVYLNQRINHDSNNIIDFYISFILNICVNIINILFSIVVIYMISKYILCVLIALTIIYMLLYSKFKIKIFKSNLEFKEKQADLFSKLNDQLKNITFIKIHNLSENFGERLNKSYSKLYDKAINKQKLECSFTFFDEIVSMFAQLTVLVLGLIGISKGTITVGILTISISYFNSILKSVKYFYEFGKLYQVNLVSYNRINELLNIEAQYNGSKKLPCIDSICIEDLQFKNNGRNIFNNLNLAFQKGYIYTLTGRNGAGKSTLMKLLTGMYINEYTGNINYNGIDINNIDMKHMREKFLSVTEQEPLLLNDTILNNLVVNLDYYDEDKLKDLINILNLKEYIDSKPLGINSVINTDSTNLSGGEKQKIAIIKSLMKKSDVIILDEPTSALDKKTILSLKNYLTLIKKNKIILIITHDNTLYDISDIRINIDENVTLECFN